LGSAWLDCGRLEKALEALQLAEELVERDLAEEEESDEEGAAPKSLEERKEEDRDIATVRAQMGVVLGRMGRNEEAGKLYEKVMALQAKMDLDPAMQACVVNNQVALKSEGTSRVVIGKQVCH